jgi:WD40 repeat protein
VWDLSDYGVISECTVAAEHGAPADGGGCTCVCWLRDEAVVSGWADASLRCHDASNMRPLWELAHAHRGGVTCVAVQAGPALSYVASGARDGSVRVWALRTRELMLQFCEHAKAVTGLVVDVRQPHLLHSAGLDCQVRPKIGERWGWGWGFSKAQGPVLAGRAHASLLV